MTQPTDTLNLLSADDLTELVGSTHFDAQAKWLRENGIPFVVGADKRVKVSSLEITHRLEPASHAFRASKGSSGALPKKEGLETPDSLDKLTEEQMAMLLGTTVKSLQHRRYRGQIPEGVWMKRGKAIYYSIRRYEEWLESVWPANVRQKDVAPSPRVKRKLRPQASFPVLV